MRIFFHARVPCFVIANSCTAERLAPKFAPTYMRLGLHYMKTGDKATARRYFEQYLSLAPKDAGDRNYAQQYMNSL